MKCTGIILKFCKVAMQTSGNDCGVYAIAYATALCLGASPVKLLFDEIAMRPRAHQVSPGWLIRYVSNKENMQEDDSENNTVHLHPLHLLNACVDGAAMIECSD